MRILAIDVGTGTQDILLYDSKKEVENSLMMVMPSPTVIVAKKIRDATSRKKTIFLKGEVMGGGPSVRAIREHIRQGFAVYATGKAALTINDDPDRVREMGIKIVDDAGQEVSAGDYEEILMQDVDLGSIGSALSFFGVDMPEKFAVAVQDHGYSPHESNRIYRFRIFEKLIDMGGDLGKFAYGHGDIPAEFTRMISTSESLGCKEAVFMDTGPAAIFGALLDPAAQQPSMVVNIGNGHTLAAIVKGHRIVALYEHHTSSLSDRHLQEQLMRFAEGELTFEEVFGQGGHGCYIRENIGFDALRSVMITGPRRGLLMDMDEKARDRKLWERLHFAAPFGNMMLSGCYGLITSYLPESRAEQ
ncbi:MAG: pyruvate formate lyase-activating protein [Methanosarcinaceae archaeon]|nr:pyruvate formate lyase-activating protein [Methanosarcinaceae archaeon]